MKKLIFLLFFIFLVFPLPSRAATFGYTTIGASDAYMPSGEAWGTKFTASEAGTGDSMSVYIKETGGNTNTRRIKCSIYDSSDNLITNGTTNEETNILNETADWFTMNFATSPSFASGVNRLVLFTNGQNPPSGDPIFNYYYDTGDTDQTGEDEGNTYPTFPDPFVAATNNTRKHSIYATYTAGGAEDTCTCTPGSDWFLSANDNCFLSTSCDLGKEYSIHILNDKGPGSFNIIDNAVLSVHSINNTSTPVNVEAGSKINFK